jgi:selenocysteine lyase/cysteine desulfurase
MTKPIVTEKELQAAREMLERTRAQTSPEDHATLVEMVEVLAEVRALVSELGGDEDDLVDGEQIWVQANQRVRARLRKPT